MSKRSLVGSFSYPLDKLELVEKVEKLADKEGLNFSELIVKLMEEYRKEHGDGNPNYELTQWVNNPDMKAVPAFFRPRQAWINYYRDCSAQDYRDQDRQLNMLLQIHNSYKWKVD